MTYEVEVRTVHTIKVQFRPGIDEEEMIKEFSDSIFRVDYIEDLVKFTAEQVARYGSHFCEGIGRVEYDHGQGWEDGVEAMFVLETDDIESEIM